MNKKIKKIVTTSVLTAITLTGVGCGTANSKLAKNIDKSMANFVTSINKLDYVETGATDASKSNSNLGKIVQTGATDNCNNCKREIKTIGNQVYFLNNNISEAEIENTITKPENQSNKFNLFVLTNTPFVSLVSDNDNNLTLNVKYSTDKIAETSNEIDTQINKLILKRSILMIYVNEIYNGNVELSNENKLAINAYVNVIKENTSFLNGNRGMVKNQLNLASDLITADENENLVNYYIIKSGEALETRSSKLESTISAIDSIIDIIENNLATKSNYYNSKLSTSYSNLFAGVSSYNNYQITETSSNTDIAKSIASSLGARDLSQNDTASENANNINIQNNSQTISQRNPLNDLGLKTSTNITQNGQTTLQNNTQNSVQTQSSTNTQNNNSVINNQNTRRFNRNKTVINENHNQINNNINQEKSIEQNRGNVETVNHRARQRRYISPNNRNNYENAQNLNTQNQTNSNTKQNIQPTESRTYRPNSTKSVVNMETENNTNKNQINNTMRADRTNDQMKFISGSDRKVPTLRTTRVPYQN